MLEGIEAIIFDLDGTLIDSMGVWREIDIEYLGKLGYDLPSDLQQCLEGMCMHDVAIYMKDRFNIPDSLQDIEKTWNDMALYKYTHEVKLKEGVQKLLDYARAKGIKLGIATSNSRLLTEAFLDSNGLAHMFDHVLTGCETFKSKPDPEVYFAAAKGLNADPSKCLVFEDITKGILAGKNAGMRVCGVEDIHSAWARDEKISLSDYYIESYNEIEYV
ncbi:MAG: HAD family phosphatase [Lachnospiraceae bacterium]|nr:HAD family phosphatase [Lachnospiraceae bacterium]